MDDYISRQAAIDEILGQPPDAHYPDWYASQVKAIPAADVVPYSIEPDGTLIITVPKGTYKNIKRVLVEEDGTHWGGLYYAD